MPFIHSFDQSKIYYSFKKGDKASLIFLHGWGLNHTIWNKTTSFLHKKGYSTIAMDIRGHGKSSSSLDKEKYTLECFAKDIYYIIKKHNLKNVVLVGHSIGGMAILTFVKMYPDIAEKIVLMDTTYENPFKQLPFIERLKKTNFTSIILDFVMKNEKVQKKVFKQVDFSKFKKSSDLYYFLQGSKQSSAASIVACATEMLNFDAKNILPEIRIPVLILVGEKDIRTPVENSLFMKEKIKNSKMIVLKEGTHDSPLTKPDDMNRELLNFLE